MGVLNFVPLPGDVTGGLRYVPLEQLAFRFSDVHRLPRSLKILLESCARGYLEGRLGEEHLARIAGWSPTAPRTKEISFFVNRILVPDSTGIPLLADLAAMRSAAKRKEKDAALVEPKIRLDLVVDHSVQIDVYGRPDALLQNTALEFDRNQERFRFIKWADAAFENLNVVPPGNGICHQINLEQLARVAWITDGVVHPDLLLGCDSHTTMINGLGVLGWGVGGIEAEAAMLGQPVTMLLPDVFGVRLVGSLPVGVTTTDLVLTVTERLRKAGVVGKFVEFFGPGAAKLSVPERATLANMAPEYGATVGYFSVDDRTLDYLTETGRPPEAIQLVKDYYSAQGMFGTPVADEISFTEVLEIDLSSVEPSIAGPKRPQDRIALTAAKERFNRLLTAPVADGGYGRPGAAPADGIADGDVILAAITSCTNTSNPQVMIAAGLLARNAVAAGLSVNPAIKTSFSPGSRAVAAYMEQLGLMAPLAQLGFELAAFGCGTCLGNSGSLAPEIEGELTANGTVGVAVLSGNRNFEARVHPAIRANFLASPPLVVAFAIAGRVTIDFQNETLPGGVKLSDIWPDPEEVAALSARAPELGRGAPPDTESRWEEIKVNSSAVYDWPQSTYIKEPPFFAENSGNPALQSIQGARPLLILGDSVTTDHISPAGAIKASSDAGQWLRAANVEPIDFNTFASRRGNHEIMMRGTFGNVRLRNKMVPDTEGGVTRHYPSGETTTVFEASRRYASEQVPVIVIAGREYGTGSSRDWAAKGPALLGVRAVIAESFERIHRGNLVGLGILPLQFEDGVTADTLGLVGNETIDVDFSEKPAPRGQVKVRISRANGKSEYINVRLCVDTPVEIDYMDAGGIMPYVLSKTLN